MSATRKYYLTKSSLGYKEGVYEASELAKLPKFAHSSIIPLSVAITKKLVNPDYGSGDSINELDLFSPTEKLARGLKEPKTPTVKIANQLRDKIQAKRAGKKSSA